MSDSQHPELTPAQFAVLVERVNNIADAVTRMAGDLSKMAEAYTRLAIAEERLRTVDDGQRRAAVTAEDHERRLRSLEASQPANTQTSKWVNAVIGLLIAAAVGAVTNAALQPRRDGPPQALEQKQ